MVLENTRAGDTIVGMNQRDVSRYSITKAINQAQDGRLDGLEREASDEAARTMPDFADTTGRSFVIPNDVLFRDQLLGTASLGGNLKATNLMAGEYIDALRNRMALAKLGVHYLTGLRGDAAIPRQLTSATINHVTEVESSTESNLTFDQVSLTPKAAAGFNQFGQKLLVQSTPSIDRLVLNDILVQTAVTMEYQALHGDGTGGAPTGIASTSGVGAVAGGTDGAAPTWAHMVELETDVSTSNADAGSLAYVTNSAVRGKLKTTPRQSSGVEGNWVWSDNGEVNGYTASVTNNVASNLTKGTSTTVCSAVFYGDWSQLILATWGAGVEVTVDPYTNASTRLVNLHSVLYYDIAVRNPAAFSAMLDALTT